VPWSAAAARCSPARSRMIEGGYRRWLAVGRKRAGR
jgi:hypothetical protein